MIKIFSPQGHIHFFDLIIRSSMLLMALQRSANHKLSEGDLEVNFNSATIYLSELPTNKIVKHQYTLVCNSNYNKSNMDLSFKELLMLANIIIASNSFL